jgi:excisionase family DNA binding protein
VSDPLLTTREVADRLRVHPDTVLRWFRAGALRGRRLPGTNALRFPESWIDEYVYGSEGGDDPDATVAHIGGRA